MTDAKEEELKKVKEQLMKYIDQIRLLNLPEKKTEPATDEKKYTIPKDLYARLKLQDDSGKKYTKSELEKIFEKSLPGLKEKQKQKFLESMGVKTKKYNTHYKFYGLLTGVLGSLIMGPVGGVLAGAGVGAGLYGCEKGANSIYTNKEERKKFRTEFYPAYTKFCEAFNVPTRLGDLYSGSKFMQKVYAGKVAAA